MAGNAVPSLSSPEAKLRRVAVPALLAAAAAAVTLHFFWPTFATLAIRWREPFSYYDHAVFVPFVCAWMAWREGAFRMGARPARFGIGMGALAVLAVTILLQLAGTAQELTVAQGTALVLWGWAAVSWFGGAGAWKRFRWPLAYWTLLIPIPTFFMSQMTLGMRQLSTFLAAVALKLITLAAGVGFGVMGNVIKFGPYRVTIIDSCSGMNTLMTVIAIGLILIYLETSRARAWLVAALLVPMAIAANLVRILILCGFIAIGWPGFLDGPGHDLVGVLTVLAAFALLAFGIRTPLRWERDEADAPRGDAPEPAASAPRLALRLAAYAVIVASAAFAQNRMLDARARAVALAAAAGPTRVALPKLQLASWKPQEMPLDPGIFGIVGTSDAHMYRFDPAADRNGLPVWFYWLHSANSRKVGHPPELCYRGEGYQIIEREVSSLQLKDRAIPAVRMVVQRHGLRLLVYYWYKIGGIETPSYLEHQLRWLWSRLTSFDATAGNLDTSMLRVSTEIERGKPDGLAVAEAKIRGWVEEEDAGNR